VVCVGLSEKEEKVCLFVNKSSKKTLLIGWGNRGDTSDGNQSFFGSFCSQKELLASFTL
jgi:hypothetical protein